MHLPDHEQHFKDILEGFANVQVQLASSSVAMQ
jgi:hypothetical protein